MAGHLPDRTAQIPETGSRCELDPAMLSEKARLFHAKRLIFPHVGSLSHATISAKTRKYWHV